MPVISGQDAEVPSVKSIVNHEQYSTIFKDTRDLAKIAAGMVDAVLSGGQPEVNDTKTYNNGVKVVPSYLLKPVAVDLDNWKTALIKPAITRPNSSSEREGSRNAVGVEELAMTAILEMRGISKSFPGVKALRNVNLTVRGRRNSRHLRRERRRQVDADEGAERRLSARLL